MKSIFIILIIFSLFISGCELVDEGEPQFRAPNMMSVPVCDHGENCGTTGGGGGGVGGGYVLTSICENAFYGTCNNPAGIDIAEVHCSNEPNLGCSGLCYVSIGSQVCGLADAGLGDCYCLNDGVCDDTYGEPSDSPDCAECTDGETQSCNLPQVPGTCGICNAGLKTCLNGEWGICDQVVPPVEEICDNILDDDCDCNADLLDADCVYTHLECQNEQCVEVDGEGFDQCSADTECIIPTYLECQNEQCIELNGTGADQCTIDLDCAAPTHLECVNEQCIEVNGEGSNQCTADNDCEITHLECIGETCAEIEGVGPDQCSDNLECVDPVYECGIIDAYWQNDDSEDTVVEGTEVSLTIVTNGYCDGETLANIKVYDEDYWTSDDTCCYLPAGQISGTTFETQWTSARCCIDEMDEVNPQFRFIAKLSDGSEITYSERLKVTVDAQETLWVDTGYEGSYTYDYWAGNFINFQAPCSQGETWYTTFRSDFPPGCEVKIGEEIITVQYDGINTDNHCYLYASYAGESAINGPIYKKSSPECAIVPDDGFRQTGFNILQTESGALRLHILDYEGADYNSIRSQIPVGSYVTVNQNWPDINEIMKVTGYVNDGSNNYPYVMKVQRGLFGTPTYPYYQHQSILKQVPGFANEAMSAERNPEPFNFLDWIVNLFS